MYQLKVVAGPGAGQGFTLQEGENSIGRKGDNQIVLDSKQVSKNHCILRVQSDSVVVRDLGSSNGTFVNGILAKEKMLKAGDRISLGDFVLQVVRSSNSTPAMLDIGGVSVPNQNLDQFESPSSAESDQLTVPSDFQGKALFYIETYFMPIFYQLLLRKQWRSLIVGMFSIFVAISVLISIYPVMDSNLKVLKRETARRAQFMAKEVVERNQPFFSQGSETKSSVNFLSRELGVREAVIVDLSNRIIAPAGKLNQYLTSGKEAAMAVTMSKAFRGGREQGAVGVYGDIVVSIEPIKRLDTQAGRNVVVGMAVVSIDSSIFAPALGGVALTFFQALIIVGIIGGILLFIFYRMTLKPLEVLNSDIDRALKGEASQVTKEFKWNELDQLLDVVNAALQQVSTDGLGGSSGTAEVKLTVEDFLSSVQMFGDSIQSGVILFGEDRRVLYLNNTIEEVTGIRSMDAVGQMIEVVSRDQAFGAQMTDLLNQSSASPGTTISEEFEFSGHPYRLQMSSVGRLEAKGFVLFASRQEFQ